MGQIEFLNFSQAIEFQTTITGVYLISNIVVRQYLNKKPHSIGKPKRSDEEVLCSAPFRRPGDSMQRITGLFYPIYTVYYDFIG